MPAPKKSVADYIAKKIAKKAVVKVKPGPNTKGMPKSPYKMPKSNVKVKPAAKTKGNSYDPVKNEIYKMVSAARRNSPREGLWGSVGKSKEHRKLWAEMKKQYSKKKSK